MSHAKKARKSLAKATAFAKNECARNPMGGKEKPFRESFRERVPETLTYRQNTRKGN